MQDPETLATVASIIAGFGIAALVFRLQREIRMIELGEIVWLPWADWLIISATSLSLLLGVLPLVAVPKSPLAIAVSAAACTGASVMLLGYPFSILAHYRIGLGRGRTGPRVNPEPLERILVITTGVLAVVGVLASFAMLASLSTS
jgi:hypothetical protein